MVELTVCEEPAALPRVPQPADDVDRLFERDHRFGGREAGCARRLDRIPKATGAKTEVEAAARKQVEACRRTGASTAGGQAAR